MYTALIGPLVLAFIVVALLSVLAAMLFMSLVQTDKQWLQS